MYAESQLQELREQVNQLGSQASPLAPEFLSLLTEFETRIGLLRRAPDSPKSFAENLHGHFAARAERGLSIETLILGIAKKRKLFDRELSKYRLQSQAGTIDEYVHVALRSCRTSRLSQRKSKPIRPTN